MASTDSPQQGNNVGTGKLNPGIPSVSISLALTHCSSEAASPLTSETSALQGTEII